MQHLANESAAQCGPCFFGLRSLSAATTRIASRQADHGDLPRLHRWTAMVKGRGACRHPDGAVAFLQSALNVFEAEFAGAAGVRGRKVS
jgi:NADH:ubiquinone oxidoreductase subunit F (NADH-binding)